MKVYRKYYIAGLYFSIVHLLYWPTLQAGMVTDFSGLIQKLDQGSAADILNSFGFPSVQPFLNLIYYLQYTLFGLSPLAWYLLFSSLFVLCTWLLYLWLKKLGAVFGIDNAHKVAFWSGLVFLALPYQSEVMVWKVALSYLLVTNLALSLLILLLDWIKKPDRRRWWGIQLLFLLSLLTFELSYALPFLALLLFFSLRQNGGIQIGNKAFWGKMSLPLLGQLLGYFLLTRLAIGAWIGHYGASVHLGVDPIYVLGNFSRYFFKYLLFGRYLGPDVKAFLFEKVSALPYLFALFVVAVSALVFLLLRYKKLGAAFQMSLLLLGLFVLALLPAITLYFNGLLFIENDRYGFLASAFFAGGLVSFFFGLPKMLRWGLLTVYLGAALFFSWKTNQYWQASSQVFRGLIHDFDYEDYDHVFILNLPDNLNGAVLFRDYSRQDLAFKDALEYVGQKKVNAQIHEVVQYNLTSLGDRVKVEKLDSSQVKVSFQQYGNWWWRRGLGATNYDNEWYRFENQGMYYILELKKMPENSVLIYQEGREWKKVVNHLTDWD